MHRIVGYHRPTSLSEAVSLIGADHRRPIGGGTGVRHDGGGAPLEVVDLQALGLGTIAGEGDRVRLGATATLQRLGDDPLVPELVRRLARAEQPSTMRTLVTVGGTIGAADPDSVLLAALVVHDAQVRFADDREASLAAVLDAGLAPGDLIVSVSLAPDGRGAVAATGRTPADTPIVAAVGRAAGGGPVVALTGVGPVPRVYDEDEIERLEPPGGSRRGGGGGAPPRPPPYGRGGGARRRRRAGRRADRRRTGPPGVRRRRDRAARAAGRLPRHARVPPAAGGGPRRPRPRGALVTTIEITLNGAPTTLEVAPHESLATALRRAGMFSVKYGSATGETGAAAVLFDGELASSDVILAMCADGHDVTTVESLNTDPGLHPIQAAFVATGAIQSGYSAGAMILGTLALLRRDPDPSEDAIRDMLSGILDRESGYVKPVEAVRRAAALMRGDSPDAFGPLVLPPMTDGTHAVEVDPGDAPPDASPAVPRLVPSLDVPDMAVVGKPEIKVDALKLAKGNPAFTDDIELRGMLYAKVLHSPHAHARIVSIDDRAAVALPGVHAVLHHGNTPRVKYASGGQSWPNPHPYDQVSFDDKVRHVGDRVAAVAAESIEIAEEALRLIDVTYEVLPAVFDELEAMKPGAPVIHDEEDTTDIFDRQRNIVHHFEAERGDVDAAFAESAHVFERTFRVHQVQQVPIEPHISIAWLDADERLVVRTATQVPFHTRRMLAPLIGMDVKQIRVIKPRIGGGFGAKQEMLIEDIVAHLAIATRRPVRLELTREEEFWASRTRHPQTISFKTGVNEDGSLHAQQMRLVGNTGPYGTHGYTVQAVSGLRGLSSYNCPNKRFDCDVAYTNIPVPGAYRGYGAPQALFALEAHMEDIAHALGRDPLEFKRQNWVKLGDELNIAPHIGERASDSDLVLDEYPRVMSTGIEECVAQGQRSIGWHRRLDPQWREPADRPHIRRGLGFAFCMHGTAIPFLDMGGCSIKLNDDGSFNMLVGATDLGTGADTVLGQIAAEVLGVRLEDIIVYSSDTDMTPFDTGAYASSTTYISGTAAKLAAEVARKRIKERAAEMLGVDEPCTIELRDRRCWAPDGRSVSMEELALHTLHWEDQEQIMGTASFVSPDCPPPFAAQFVEIEVDIETGQVEVVKMTMAVDCGVAINPITASGQVEGGMVQALGYAHCEEFAFDGEGRMINDTLGPYKIYRADEMPATEVFLVQTMEDSGPFGAKAVAEIPKDGVAPAIRNAIINATGVAIDDLPFTPERVWQALQRADH